MKTTTIGPLMCFIVLLSNSCWCSPQVKTSTVPTNRGLTTNEKLTLQATGDSIDMIMKGKLYIEDAGIFKSDRHLESSTSSDLLEMTSPRPRISVITPNLPRVTIPFVIGMWVFATCTIKLVLNSWPKLLSIIPESGCLIMVGLVFGLIFYMTNTSVLSPLSSTIFFFVMLPPIILDAGYFMPNRIFFDNLGTILFFAVGGTIFSAICIGFSIWACGLTGLYGFDISLLQSLLFSCLISAVDPVAVLAVLEELHVDLVLYIIVFGESLLNDAVSCVLYNMIDSYINLEAENIETADVLTGFASFVVLALCGSAIGVFWGFSAGLITKYTNRVHVIEPVFVFIMSYAALINAEALQMSGIFSVFFCGITMKNYVGENMSPTSLTTVNRALKMLSNGSESIIFIFLGVSTVIESHEWNTAFVLLAVFFCTLYRALGVVLLTAIANYFRLRKISRNEKLIMSYGGLRGAIAFALVLLVDPHHIPHKKLFVTSTLAVLYFTVFFQGITTRPLVNFLKIKREERREKTMNERVHEKTLDYAMIGVVDVLDQFTHSKLRDKFKRLDNAYIRPYLIREKSYRDFREPKIIETYTKLTLHDATEFAGRKPCNWGRHITDSFEMLIKNDANTLNLTQASEAVDTLLVPGNVADDRDKYEGQAISSAAMEEEISFITYSEIGRATSAIPLNLHQENHQ